MTAAIVTTAAIFTAVAATVYITRKVGPRDD